MTLSMAFTPSAYSYAGKAEGMLCTARKAARPAEQKSPPAGFRRLCRPGGLSRTQPGVSASRAWAALRQPRSTICSTTFFWRCRASPGFCAGS